MDRPLNRSCQVRPDETCWTSQEVALSHWWTRRSSHRVHTFGAIRSVENLVAILMVHLSHSQRSTPGKCISWHSANTRNKGCVRYVMHRSYWQSADTLQYCATLRNMIIQYCKFYDVRIMRLWYMSANICVYICVYIYSCTWIHVYSFIMYICSVYSTAFSIKPDPHLPRPRAQAWQVSKRQLKLFSPRMTFKTHLRILHFNTKHATSANCTYLLYISFSPAQPCHLSLQEVIELISAPATPNLSPSQPQKIVGLLPSSHFRWEAF